MHHGVETANVAELGLKLCASLFQQPYIGLAVRQQFVLEIENVSFGYFFAVPFVEFFFSLRGHSIGIVVGFVGHVPFVDLVLLSVEEMWKEAFLQFIESECFREVGQCHGKKVHGVDEFEVG